MPHPTSATFVRDLTGFPEVSDQKLWRLDHPIPYQMRHDDGSVTDCVTSYIVSSHAFSDTLRRIQGSGEVYIFPSNEDGTILDWAELPGSQKGDVPHQQVIDSFLTSFLTKE